MKTLSVLFAVVALSGCYMPTPKPSRTETLSRTVSLGTAESVSVTIALGVGKLKISGGAAELLDARVEYNIPDWKPEISYEVENGRGRLVVEQPSRVVGAAWPGNVRYDWDLKLSDSVPIELNVDLGVGKSELDLRGLNLSRVEVDAGIGEGTVDLSGNRVRDLEAEIEAGIGRLTVILPRDIGTQVKIDGAIGHVSFPELKTEGDAYVNEAWGKTPVKLKLEIEGGIGEVTLKLAD